VICRRARALQRTIVTNNPAVRDKHKACALFIEGSAEQVLIRVRDMVHQGYELISHPLPASLGIMFSPYRSVIIGEKRGAADHLEAEVAEESIWKYRQKMSSREIDAGNNADYRLIDLLLLEAALKEDQGGGQPPG